MSTTLLDNIRWLGHDGFEIVSDDITLAIDPFKIESGRKADVILVTHPHYDHCSPEDITKLIKTSSVIVTEKDSAKQLGDANIQGDIQVLKPGESLTISGILIEAVAAYNVNKSFHTKDKNWLGFIITINGERIYHAGDTDLIPEMDKTNADIALLPVSGTYVMTAEEAVIAAKRIKPSVAIPMHYDSIVGTEDDAKTFRQALDGVCRVVVLQH